MRCGILHRLISYNLIKHVVAIGSFVDLCRVLKYKLNKKLYYIPIYLFPCHFYNYEIVS